MKNQHFKKPKLIYGEDIQRSKLNMKSPHLDRCGVFSSAGALWFSEKVPQAIQLINVISTSDYFRNPFLF